MYDIYRVNVTRYVAPVGCCQSNRGRRLGAATYKKQNSCQALFIANTQSCFPRTHVRHDLLSPGVELSFSAASLDHSRLSIFNCRWTYQNVHSVHTPAQTNGAAHPIT